MSLAAFVWLGMCIVCHGRKAQESLQEMVTSVQRDEAISMIPRLRTAGKRRIQGCWTPLEMVKSPHISSSSCPVSRRWRGRQVHPLSRVVAVTS
jgi:hypothetical protein